MHEVGERSIETLNWDIYLPTQCLKVYKEGDNTSRITIIIINLFFIFCFMIIFRTTFQTFRGWETFWIIWDLFPFQEAADMTQLFKNGNIFVVNIDRDTHQNYLVSSTLYSQLQDRLIFLCYNVTVKPVLFFLSF